MNYQRAISEVQQNSWRFSEQWSEYWGWRKNYTLIESKDLRFKNSWKEEELLYMPWNHEFWGVVVLPYVWGAWNHAWDAWTIGESYRECVKHTKGFSLAIAFASCASYMMPITRRWVAANFINFRFHHSFERCKEHYGLSK